MASPTGFRTVRTPSGEEIEVPEERASEFARKPMFTGADPQQEALAMMAEPVGFRDARMESGETVSVPAERADAFRSKPGFAGYVDEPNPPPTTRLMHRAIDGTYPYFSSAIGGAQEEGRLPVGSDPQDLLDRGYTLADRDTFLQTRERMDPLKRAEAKDADVLGAAYDDFQARLSAQQRPSAPVRAGPSPAPRRATATAAPVGDTPEDLDALQAGLDDLAARSAQQQRGGFSGAAANNSGSTSTPPAPQPPVAPRQAVGRAPSQDMDLVAAQQRANLTRAIAGMSRAGSKIAAAIGHRQPDLSGAAALEASADTPVAQHLQRKQAAMAEDQRAQQAAQSDPTSPASQRIQAYVRRAFGSVYAPEEIAQMTAADAPFITKVGEMRAQLDARAQERADTLADRGEDRASREKMASEAVAARKEDSRQRSLDRGLQRELAAQHHKDTAAKQAAKPTAPPTVPAGEAADLGEATSALEAVDVLYKQFTDKAGGITGGITGMIPGTDATQYGDDDRRAAAQVIGRFLEGGKLAAGDEVKYMNLMPAPGDGDARAKNKVANLTRLIGERQQKRIAGLKAAGFTTGELGAQPVGPRHAVKRVPNKDRTKYRIDYSDGTSEVVNATSTR